MGLRKCSPLGGQERQRTECLPTATHSHQLMEGLLETRVPGTKVLGPHFLYSLRVLSLPSLTLCLRPGRAD